MDKNNNKIIININNNPEINKSLLKTLKNCGYEVLAASSSEEAAEISFLLGGTIPVITVPLSAHVADFIHDSVYKTIFESTGTFMFLVEKDMTISKVNQNFLKEFGYSRGEVEGKMKWTDLVASDHVEFMTNQHKIRRKKSGQALTTYEFKYKRKSGSINAGLITVGMIAGTDLSIASITDISELKKTKEELIQKNEELHSLNEELAAINEEFEAINEELIHTNAQLEENELRYRTLFENTGSGIIVIEEDTTVSLANETFTASLGYSRDEIENKMKWTEMVSQEDLEFMLNQHKLRRRELGKAESSYEFRFKNKKGELRDNIIFLSMIPGTKKSIASLFDITDRKEVERKLRISENKYRSVFENIQDVFYQTNTAGIITEMSPSIENYSGFSRKELIGKSVSSMYYDLSDRENFLKIILAKGKVIDFELRLKTKDNRLLMISTTSHIVRDSKGKLCGFEGILRDITERKLAEEEKSRIEKDLYRVQKMEVIGTLAGGIAHNFNNILMGIMGYTSLLLSNKDLSNPDFEYLKNIEESVRSASELTKNLLGFARGGKYEVKPTDMNSLIRNEIKIFSQTRKDIVIHSKYEEGISMVNADQGQLRQVLLNLFINAWQAMPGGGSIYVKTENVLLTDNDTAPYKAATGVYVKISVTDTGIGMDKKTLDNIFTPFFSTKNIDESTGLGLASAYGIIANHGGIIQACSEKGKGATFEIFLPVLTADPGGVIQEETYAEQLISGNGTVLLIDDEKYILKLCEKMLNHLGYKTIKCESGTKAVECFLQMSNDIKIVILDMTMPYMSGGETFDRLKEINPHVPVLLSSGYAVDGEAQEILNRGCRGFIQKPFTIFELSKKISDILKSII